MSDVNIEAIKRLQESKAKSVQKLFTSGEAAGERYVLNHADWLELDRLQRWSDSLGPDRSLLLERIVFQQVANQMNENTGKEISDTLRERHGNVIDNPAWIEGFIVGATNKFEELKPGLD